NEHQIDSTHILGYSLGGYVACMLAEGHPDRVSHMVTLGTRYPWDAATAEREVSYLNPEQIEAKVPQFARLLAERHTALGWKKVVEWTAELLRANAAEGGLSAKRLSRLEQPIRIIVGDRDSTAGVAESLDVYRTLQHGQLEVLPNTPHPFERVDLARLAQSVRNFCLQSTGT
ncbi:MAG: alpha/beta hydrolase, partial [Candidatus Tectomicrobia bacterium]|nr:alpha/beta hydrolase [Candidatus Tectomicrobia bacterium]